MEKLFSPEAAAKPRQSSNRNVIDWRTIDDKYGHIDKVSMPIDRGTLASFLEGFNKIPIVQHSESRIIARHPNIIRIVLPEIRDFHLGGMGTNYLSGASIASMMDCALGVPGVLQFYGKPAGTIDLAIKMLRPVAGSFAYADGFVVRKTKNIAFCEAYLYDDTGQVCSIAHGSVASV